MSKYIFLFLMVLETITFAKSITYVNIGGVDYDIKEKNIVKLMQEYVVKNKSKIDNKLKKIQKELKSKMMDYEPSTLTKKIFPATKNKTHYPDPIYTLKNDIKDAKGNIIYKKGYSFNPLHYITLTDKYIFFDYSNKDQVKWIIENSFHKDITVRLILINGRVFNAMKFFEREVFYANDKLLNKFDIWASPSIVVQEGDRIKVEEYYIRKEKK